MSLRYAGTCRVCSMALPAKTDAIYERATKTVRCSTYDDHEPSELRPSEGEQPPVAAPDEAAVVGTPVVCASGVRAPKRLPRATDPDRASQAGRADPGAHRRPQTTRAPDVGAVGRGATGPGLNEFATDTLRVLHDRRIPGSRTNIDHLAVTATGVYVIDAKKYQGRPRLKVEGGLLRPRAEKAPGRQPQLHAHGRRSHQAGRRGPGQASTP
jgi:hypothetical protein